jgi:hypothetical protein
MKTKNLLLASAVLLTFSASLILFNLSCNKPADAQTPTNCNEPNTVFKYTLNGTLYDMSGSLALNSKQGAIVRKTYDWSKCDISDQLTCTDYLYSLSATKNNVFDDEWNTILRFWFPATIKPGSYSTSTNTLGVLIIYPEYTNTNNFTVTITKNQGGYIDGVFSGTVKSGSNQTTYQITDGVFQNVKILE